MKNQVVRERAKDFYLLAMLQHTLSAVAQCLTLEFSDDPPADEIILIFRSAAYGTIAADLATAGTNLADPTKRRQFAQGEAVEYFANAGKLWFVSYDAGTHTEAVCKEVYRGET